MLCNLPNNDMDKLIENYHDSILADFLRRTWINTDTEKEEDDDGSFRADSGE